MADERNGPQRGFGALDGMVTKYEEGAKTPGNVGAARPVPPSTSHSVPARTSSTPLVPIQEPAASKFPTDRPWLTPVRAAVIGIGVWMLILNIVLVVGGMRRKQSTSDRTPAPAGATGPLQFDEPLPLPASGVMYTYGSFGGPNRRLEAPFQIKAGQGSHFLVKLVHVGTNQPAMTIFVRSGETVEAEVPLGTFEVRYASGDTWYGDDLLFGPKTSYSKADTLFTFEIVGNQVQGFTITLYTVANGNLKTKEIGASEF